MLAEEVRQFLKGEVLDDPETLKAYSRDASIFVMKPALVVYPRDAEDVKALAKFAATKKAAGEDVHLTARSGGTDMSGGAIGASIVVDFTKHLNVLGGIEVSEDGMHGEAVVQPGMYYRDFERETLKHGLLMPSYPASRELCTVGGMVANNAGGEKTLAYGKTEDYIAGLKVVLADGEEYVIRPLSGEELQAKLMLKGFEGELYRNLYDLLRSNDQKIKAARPDVSKNSAGYYLWNVWDRETGRFDLPKLIVGSQGTLGLVTEITFRLVRPAPCSLMAVVFLKDIFLVDEVVDVAMKFKPESFESYDDKTLKLAFRFFPQILARVRGNKLKFMLSFLPDLWMLLAHGWPKLVLLIEIAGDSEEEIYPRLEELRNALRQYKLPVMLTRHQSGEEKYWITRRESFSLLRKNVKNKHTLPVVDDIIVKPEHLPKFLPELEGILDKYKKYLTSTIAGHVGNGNFHVIPLMDFRKPEARAIVRPLMDEVYALTLKYKGSITAEHNDGMVRGPYLAQMYGEEIAGLFRKTKAIFDPTGIFNPGKKIEADLDSALAMMVKE